MLFLFTIFILLVAGISIAVFVKRLVASHLLEGNHRNNLAAENFRPLFAPTDEDIRAFEREQQAEIAAKESEEQRQLLAQKLAIFEELRQTWQESANRTNTIELLYHASQSESGEAYSQAAETVLEAWHAGKIADLSGSDLAQLLESHFWLLPADERTPGVSFRLNSEIADLRRLSDENNRSA